MKSTDTKKIFSSCIFFVSHQNIFPIAFTISVDVFMLISFNQYILIVRQGKFVFLASVEVTE